MERLFLILAGAFGALGVAFGAFGAHGLRARLSVLPDGADRRAFWETAAHYHLIHALAMGLAAYVVVVGKREHGARRGAEQRSSTLGTVAGFCFAGGIVLFSGSLYAMTLTGIRALGAVTPVGGLLFVAGWVSVALSAWQMR
ncbi:MAG TPA: DUF423 domain-containing protein [Polyangiaceae bacterium]